MSARGVLGDLKRCTRKSEPYDSTWERDYMQQLDADEQREHGDDVEEARGAPANGQQEEKHSYSDSV